MVDSTNRSSCMSDKSGTESCPPVIGGTYRPPPPLRTTNTYDDDDAFHSVALNLLARHQMTVGSCVSPESTIKEVLLKSQDRRSFWEALQHRKTRSVSPTAISKPCSLLDDIERIFASDLKRLVESEKVSLKRQECIGHSSSWSKHEPIKKKKKKCRRFFASDTSSFENDGFFRLGNRLKIKNIDWSLTETVSQVQSLRLDGVPNDNFITSGDSYEPPAME